ncbi:hypothetical protein [Thermus caldilimi]|uniref:hypothetical protein n=1 Tax=Thermus caldilimi TaxID=2483360 RepID=UPI001075FE0B|nr:hypothetical protein [Thermus caldilimi]
MNREAFKALLLELLLEDPDVGDAVLASRQKAEGRDMAFIHEGYVVSSSAYRRAKDALRKLLSANEPGGEG